MINHNNIGYLYPPDPPDDDFYMVKDFVCKHCGATYNEIGAEEIEEIRQYTFQITVQCDCDEYTRWQEEWLPPGLYI